MLSAVQARVPSVAGADLNPNGKPKRGTFEVEVVSEKGKKGVTIWSGTQLGPPRRLKVPEDDVVADKAEEVLGKK